MLASHPNQFEISKIRRGSTPVYIDNASVILLGASFGFKVHQPDFEDHQLPFVVFHKNLGYPKVPIWIMK